MVTFVFFDFKRIILPSENGGTYSSSYALTKKIFHIYFLISDKQIRNHSQYAKYKTKIPHPFKKYKFASFGVYC